MHDVWQSPPGRSQQVRVARPTRDLAAARSFYAEHLGLPVLGSFEDHDGYSGVILGVPDDSLQLELVLHAGTAPTPTDEDQLVLYLGSPDRLAEVAARLHAAGVRAESPANPYWTRHGALGFRDPDGYWLILVPGRFGDGDASCA